MGQLSNIIVDYLDKNRTIRWATRDKRERVFRYLIDAVGDINIRDFGYAEAENFQVYLADRVRFTSCNSYIKSVSPIISWAVRRGFLSANPFEQLKPFKIPQEEIRVFNSAEVQAILLAAPTNLWRGRILAAVSAGLRRSEVLNLTWDDIDFELQVITVRAKRNTATVWEWIPKNYQIRKLPLIPQLHNLLLNIMVELPVGQPYPLLPEKRYWLLCQRIGRLSERVRITPDENWKPFRNILRAAEINNGRFRDLRRTAITQWSRRLPYQEVQRLAGHADIETTLRYYSAVGADYIDRARQIGATGLEPATS